MQAVCKHLRQLLYEECIKACYKNTYTTSLHKLIPRLQITDYAMCLCTCAWPCVRSNAGLYQFSSDEIARFYLAQFH